MSTQKAKPVKKLKVVWTGPADKYIHGILAAYFSGEPFTVPADEAKRLLGITTKGKGRFQICKKVDSEE